MELEKAIEGMIKTREALRSGRGITDPSFISEQMQRLAQYTGAVEEHLAEVEGELELEEMRLFVGLTKDQAKSVSQAETIVRKELGDKRGQIAKLKRLVSSSWQIVGVSQSRWNHLNKSAVGQV